MILRLHNLSLKLSSFTSISKTKAMNFEKCYIRYIQQNDKVELSFMFKVKDSMRQFNFSRCPMENLDILNQRIITNLKKALQKCNKKSSAKDDILMEVGFFDKNNSPIDEKRTFMELFDLDMPVKLKINGYTYEAVFNSPWILNINLPQSLLAGFPVYPEKLEMLYTDSDNCIFNWYKGPVLNEKGKQISDIHIKWEYVGNNNLYIPQTQDIGMKLKLECVPGNKTSLGPAVETVSKHVVEAGPGKCPFETRHMFTNKKLSEKSFRCVSYNILADLYCDSDYTRTILHPYCPPYALHIDYRKQLIVKELLGYNADIICLQEVDSKMFNSYFKPLLATDGMVGEFYKKGKQVAEGLTCFYRNDRFRKIGYDHIVLSEVIKTAVYLQPIWCAIKDNSPLINRLLDRSTVASATYLQSTDNRNDIIIVANTHLYFHPDADHIRLIQGGILIYWLMDLKRNMIAKFPNKRISTIICGDFNSVPSCGIYQLYTTGESPSNLPDWQSNLEEAVHNLCLTQDIALASACGTPPYTNFTAGFADCLDYIFYEKNNLDVEQVIPFPSEDELRAHTALPSIVFPSDHLALISDLHFR